MNRKLVGILVALLLCVSVVGAFAEKKSDSLPWLVNYNSAGQFDAAVSVGWTEFGFGAAASGYMTFGEFDLGPIPLSWGVAVEANFGFGWGMGLGVGAFACIDGGVDWGNIWKFEYQVGVGPGFTLGLTNYYGDTVGFGLAQYFAGTWWFSEKMGLTVEEIYAYMWGPDLYAYTFGVEFKL
jgi:hypothetical protein